MNYWPNLSLERTADYRSCFGCGHDNPIGLKLVFKWDGKIARSEVTPGEVYQGWPGLLHGGIIACILDEAMGYAALFDAGRCVTAKMEILLKRPIKVKERLLVTSSVQRKSRKLVKTVATITLEDGTPVAGGSGTHFIVDMMESSITE